MHDKITVCAIETVGVIHDSIFLQVDYSCRQHKHLWTDYYYIFYISKWTLGKKIVLLVTASWLTSFMVECCCCCWKWIILLYYPYNGNNWFLQDCHSIYVGLCACNYSGAVRLGCYTHRYYDQYNTKASVAHNTNLSMPVLFAIFLQNGLILLQLILMFTFV